MVDDIEIDGFRVRLQPHGPAPGFKGNIYKPGGAMAQSEIALGNTREACIADATAIIKKLRAK